MSLAEPLSIAQIDVVLKIQVSGDTLVFSQLSGPSFTFQRITE